MQLRRVYLQQIPLLAFQFPGIFRGGAAVPAGNDESRGADRGTDHRFADRAADGPVHLQGRDAGGRVRGAADAVLGARGALGLSLIHI